MRDRRQQMKFRTGSPINMIRVTRRPGINPAHGLMTWGSRVWPCRLGKAGLTSSKREGDRATPRSTMTVVGAYVRQDRSKRRLLQSQSMKLITLSDGWCDAPDHPSYNSPVQLPFAASHEMLHRADRLYDIILVLDWNMAPNRSRGLGSAIFLHVAPEDPQAGTHGCIALEPNHMNQFLALAQRMPGPLVVKVD